MQRRQDGQRRERVVLGAGVLSAAALVWAALAVHARLDDAGELAVTRLAGAASDAVVEEWQRWRERPEAPLEARVDFEWRPGAEREPVAAPEEPQASGATLSVAATLLAEAERRELALADFAGALELVEEVLARPLDAGGRAERVRAELRAVQLTSRLGDPEATRAHWAALRRSAHAEEREGGVPLVLLGWLALPPALAAESSPHDLVDADTWAGVLREHDQLVFWPGEPEPRFHLASEVEPLARRLGLSSPPREVRAGAALAVVLGALPYSEPDGLWRGFELAGRPFLARSGDGVARGFFVDTAALAEALLTRAALPNGFALDFQGTDESSGVALRPAVSLPEGGLAFTLRHAEPAHLARIGSNGITALRTALLVLAGASLAGAILTARVLARERRLAELKSAFVAGVSHDLRTPLASILLLAENLETGRVGPEQHARYHQAIRTQAERLRRLVDDVLDFSRLERGQGPRIALEEVDLAGFVEELAAEAAARAGELERSFEVKAKGLPRASTLDPVALRRALLNLVENALRHGAGAVELSASVAGDRLRLAVRDHGPGVPRSEAERLFRPFESRLPGHNGHARSAGVGLGLAIVRAVARAHGGEASARLPAEGPGAEFVIEIPLEGTCT